MEIGDKFKGTPEEFENLIKIEGFHAEKFFKLPSDENDGKINNKVFYSILCLFVIIYATLICVDCQKCSVICFILSLALGGIISIVVAVKLDKIPIGIFSFIVVFMISALAHNSIKVEEVVAIIKEKFLQ